MLLLFTIRSDINVNLTSSIRCFLESDNYINNIFSIHFCFNMLCQSVLFRLLRTTDESTQRHIQKLVAVGILKFQR